jgi:hypothetical protein
MYISPEHFGRQSGLCWTVAKFPLTLTRSVPEFLARNKRMLPPHPVCFPDLVLCDVFLFLKVKKWLMKGNLIVYPLIQAKSKDTFATFQTVNFMKCFEWCNNYYAHCVMTQGHYTEGSNID